jgi:hypothetical protein
VIVDGKNLQRQNNFFKQAVCDYICVERHPFIQLTADFLRQIDYFSNQESIELTAHGLRDKTSG